MTARILAVEDHPAMREMLVQFLFLPPEFEVAAVARTGEQALDEIGEIDPEVVLVDVALPGMTGIELVRRIRSSGVATPCVMLSGHQDASYVRQALEAGASAYVVKGNPDEIVEAIRTVLRGDRYVPDAEPSHAVP
jgi:DNA-binding NarL/FixJ family response regulator